MQEEVRLRDFPRAERAREQAPGQREEPLPGELRQQDFPAVKRATDQGLLAASQPAPHFAAEHSSIDTMSRYPWQSRVDPPP